MKNWPVQDAKARFSELLDTCLREGPQMVTKRGAAAAVLVPLAEWQRLQQSARPTFDITDPFVATLLGSIVSLTPGTVSIEIDMREKTLFVHALDVEDEAALIASIRSRSEAPLKEIFGC